MWIASRQTIAETWVRNSIAWLELKIFSLDFRDNSINVLICGLFIKLIWNDIKCSGKTCYWIQTRC